MKHLPSHCLAIVAMLALWSAATPAWAEKFTIAVVSDPQNYTDATQPQPRGVNTFVQQMQYLANTRRERRLVFVTFVGDIVQHGDGRFVQALADGRSQAWDTRGEWDGADQAIGALDRARIPFGMAPGNHDYDNAARSGSENNPVALAGGRAWDAHFGARSRHFAGKSWYGGAFNQGLNSYQFFSGGGKRFLHVSLEMEPTPAALAWAQGVIDAHPGLPVIVTTHAWLQPALKPASGQRGNWHQRYFPGTDHLTADQVWERFIRKNPAIFLVLCGHDWTPTVNGVSQGENLRIDRNDAGYPVYQVLQDYQGQTRGADGRAGSASGGAGWLRLVEFDTATRKIHFSTWSTLLGRYAGRNGERTFGADAKYSDFVLDFPPQLILPPQRRVGAFTALQAD